MIIIIDNENVTNEIAFWMIKSTGRICLADKVNFIPIILNFCNARFASFVLISIGSNLYFSFHSMRVKNAKNFAAI